MGKKTKILKEFDRDGNGVLNKEERKAAREQLAKQGTQRGPGRRGGPPGGPGGADTTPTPGAKVALSDVKVYPDADLYDTKVLRTFFLEFEDADWEKEMSEFYHTDVDLPAKLTVDGKVYPDVGVRFRGNSSYFSVGAGGKRSLNLSLDLVKKDQNIGGYHTLNLMNSHEDPSFLHIPLYCTVARNYLPAPKANFVRVVINGESWGIYANLQQFNKEFVKEWYGTTKGARWKIPGSPGGRGGFNYLGEDLEPYKKIYEIKSKDTAKPWGDFIRLCKLMEETPADKLVSTISPILDIEGVLKFLALDISLINGDGFWTRASDYFLYQDEKGQFHVIPNDINETFSVGGGPGGPGGMRGPGGFGGRRGRPASQEGAGGTGNVSGGPDGTRPPQGQRSGGPGGMGRGNGYELDPLTIASDSNKPLASKLLAVPELRAKFLGYVRDIAQNQLDWAKLGPMAQEYHDLIEADVKADTRKLYSTEAFLNSVAGGAANSPTQAQGGRGGSLKDFAEKRRAYLLNYKEPVKTASTQ